MRPTRLLALTCGLFLVVSTPASAADDLTGSAFAVSVRTTLLNSVDVGVGPLPKAAYPKGADKSVVSLDLLTDAVVKARLLNASSQVQAGVLTSKASIAEVDIPGVLTAKLVTATCTSKGVAESKLVDVVVAGKKIEVAGTSEVTVGDLITVRVNEQLWVDGTLTVNALHVIVGGAVGKLAKAEVILSQAKCSSAGIGSTPTTPTKPTGSTTPSPSTTAPSTPPASTSASSAAPVPNSGIVPAAGTERLAETGVSAALPLTLGGLLLLAGGAALVWRVRRVTR